MTNQDATQNLAPRLRRVRVGVRAELETTRQIFNGEPCYVVRDPISFQTFKFSPDDYQVFVALNDSEELGTIFDRLVEREAVDADEEEDFFQFIIHLNQVGILTLPVSDGKSLYERFMQRRAGELKAKLLGIFFLRVPLFQPNQFLNRTIHLVRPIFSRAAFAIWLISLMICGCIIASHWSEFCDPLATMLTLKNIPILWSLIVFLKIFHEFGHAYACKHFGGDVPEMGAFFIVGTPCAYVDASASWGFGKSRHRIMVALAGMYFESILAMIALFIWTFTSPGIVHSAAQYAVVLSTIVTIGFNANPLMKYDGYYVLGDLLGMPNLKGDSQQQLNNDLKRAFFGIRRPAIGRTFVGRIFLSLFGFASAVYKLIVIFGISVMIAFKVPALGIGLAGFYVVQTIWQSLTKLLGFLLKSPELESNRLRAFVVTTIVAAAAFLSLTLLPIPGNVKSTGVVRRTLDTPIHAPSDGFLTSIEVLEGACVPDRQPLFQLKDVELETKIVETSRRINELQIQMQSESEFAQAARTRAKIHQIGFEKNMLVEQKQNLHVLSPVDGVVSFSAQKPRLGTFVKRGQHLATVHSGEIEIRTLISASDVSNCRPQPGDPVNLISLGSVSQTMKGEIVRVAPWGSREISEVQLTHLANGSIAVSGENHAAEQPYFLVRIRLPAGCGNALPDGSTVYVQFRQHQCTVAEMIYRRSLKIMNRLRMTAQ